MSESKLDRWMRYQSVIEKEAHNYYNLICLPNNLLIRTFEHVDGEVSGSVYINVHGCITIPKVEENDGHLTWSANLLKGSGYYQTARIHDLVVSERFRRQGLATALVKAAEDRMRAFGVKTIGGKVSKDGLEFFPKQGYSLIGGGRTLFKDLEATI